MNDRQIAALLMTHVKGAMAASPDLVDVLLVRNFQSRQQGAASGPAVYFVKIGDNRYGHVERKDVYNETSGAMDHIEKQAYLSTWQFSAWIPQTPADITALTESDVLNLVSGIIQSDNVLEALRGAGLGVLRVTEVRNPYLIDDRDTFEATPSFDVTFSHSRVTTSTVPTVTTYDASIHRV